MGDIDITLGAALHRFPEFGDVYYVDGTDGSDENNGKAPSRAFATVQAGLNAARYTAGTITVNTDKNRRAVVFVAPGHYDEEIAFSGYNISLIGCGVTPGKDYGPSINYSGATDSNAGIAFSGSGIEIAGFHVEMQEALPGIWCAGGDNNWIHHNVVEGDYANATYGIQMNSCKQSIVEDNFVANFMTAQIYLPGGADKYAVNGAIRRNYLYSPSSAGCKGIFVHANMTSWNFAIEHNFVDNVGGGATGKGIDNDSGQILIADNFVVHHASGTAIEDAGGCSLGNRSRIVSGNVVDPNPANT